MPELINNGGNGFLLSNIDEAVKAVGAIDNIDRASCRKIVENRFTVNRMVQEYINVYQSIFNKPHLSEE